jgi:hypothetical protein
MRRPACSKDFDWMSRCTLALSLRHAARRGISQSTNRKYRRLSSPATTPNHNPNASQNPQSRNGPGVSACVRTQTSGGQQDGRARSSRCHADNPIGPTLSSLAFSIQGYSACPSRQMRCFLSSIGKIPLTEIEAVLYVQRKPHVLAACFR